MRYPADSGIASRIRFLNRVGSASSLTGVGRLAYRTLALALTVVCSCGGGAKPKQSPDSGVGAAPGGRGGSAGGSGGATASGAAGEGTGGRAGTAGGAEAGSGASRGGTGGSEAGGVGGGVGGDGATAGGTAGTAGGSNGGALGGTAGGVAGSSGGAGAAGGGGGGAAGSGNCGGYDQPCCSGGTKCANSDSICGRLSVEAPPTCLRCGVPGGPCCLGRRCDGGCCISLGGSDNNWRCIARGATCSVDGISVEGVCELDGSCTSCGGTGKVCCEDRVRSPGVHWCAVPGTTCVREQTALTGTCEPCGAQDQRCCVSTEQAFPVPSCPAPLRCDSTTRTCRAP